MFYHLCLFVFHKALFRHVDFYRCLCSLCCLGARSAIQCPLTVGDPHWTKILGNKTLGSKGTIQFCLDGHSGQKSFPFVSAPGLFDILCSYMIHMVHYSHLAATNHALLLLMLD